MTKPSKILWFTFSVAALLLASRASAQTYVTPTVAPTPPGQLIVVNNGPAKDADDLHVSGDLVSYSYSDSTNFTVRYFNLATRVDAGVPNNGTFFDFLADVRGSVIVFTHVSSSSSAIFQFDTANPSNPPVEVNPVSGSARQQPQIRDQTIAWQESSSGSVSDIVAYDRVSGSTQRLTPLSVAAAVEQSPAISPDGTVVVYVRCATISSPCSTWKATLSNGTWTAQQLVSQSRRKSVPSRHRRNHHCVFSEFRLRCQLAWQPLGGGIENVLNISVGNASIPSISDGPQNSLIAFSYLPPGGSFHDLALYKPATALEGPTSLEVQQ